MVQNLPATQATWVPSLRREDHWEENGHPLQYSGLENPMDGGDLVGYSLWGRKESDTTEGLTLTLSRPYL